MAIRKLGLIIVGLTSIMAVAGGASAQITIDPSSYAFCEAQGIAGYVFSGYLLPVMDEPFDVAADATSSVSLGDGTFANDRNGSGGTLRLDVDHVRSGSLGDLASTAMLLGFTITQEMPYELTGEYVYFGHESAHYLVSLYSTGCIYCGEQNMNEPGTATVGTLPGGVRPDGPTTGVLPPGTYSIILESFVYANLGEGVADAHGFVQLRLGAPPCPADFDGDGGVNVADLLTLLAAWGPNPGHVADIDGNGEVDVADLLALLAAWGPC